MSLQSAIDKLKATVLTSIRSGHLDNARVLINRALRDEPDNACLHHLSGAVSFLRGDAVNAERSLLQAVALDNTIGEAHFDLALAQAQLGKMADAIQSLKIALGLRPDNHAARLHLALLMMHTGDNRTALEHLMHLGDQATDPQQRDLLIAKAAFECGENDLALTRLDSLKYVRAEDALTMLLAGQLSFELADYQRAHENFTKAEGLKVQAIAAAVPVELMLVNPLANHNAQAAFAELISGIEDEARAAFKRGIIWLAMKRPEKALTWLKRACALDADHHDYTSLTATTLETLGAHEEARALYEILRNKNPQSSAAQIVAAEQENENGNFTKAQEILAIISDGENNPRYLHAFGKTHLGLGQNEEAITYLKQGCQLAPENSDLHADLARAYFSSGKINQAKKELQLLQLIDQAAGSALKEEIGF